MNGIRIRRIALVAVIAASALSLCLTAPIIRLMGIGAYACLGCGFIGAIASDWVARFLHNIAHAPDWVGYVGSYTVFFSANAVFFFGLFYGLSATAQAIARIIRRKQRQLL